MRIDTTSTDRRPEPSGSSAARSAARALAPLLLSASVLTPLLLLSHPLRPVQASAKEDRIAGAALFHDKGCIVCHGPEGLGTDRAPDLSSIGRIWKREQIETQIVHGGKQMPPFGEALQPDEVKQLVEFLATKKKPVRKSAPAAPPAAEPAATREEN
jgi:mono/diheme cytochrome c family protein